MGVDSPACHCKVGQICRPASLIAPGIRQLHYVYLSSWPIYRPIACALNRSIAMDFEYV
jgi:hypothetical protein